MFHYHKRAAEGEAFPAQAPKPYGVFELRANYAATLLRALLFTSASVISVVLIAWYASRTAPAVDNSGQVDPPIIVIPFDATVPPDEPKPSESRPSKSAAAATGASTSTLVIDSVPLLDDVATSTAISTASAETTGGTDGGSSGTGSSTTSIANAAGSATATLNDYEVTELPQFEGGMGALMKFLQSNLRYPEPALSLGHQGKIHVRFVIDEKGRVCDIKLLNSLGDGLDEEALRVVKLIPDFKSPAKLNGRAVKVYYSLPISFRVR